MEPLNLFERRLTPSVLLKELSQVIENGPVMAQHIEEILWNFVELSVSELIVEMVSNGWR